MKPVIGVIPLYDETKESLWMLPGYFDGLAEQGGIPLMFPLVQDREMLNRLVSMCDGILFTGGHDVSPELYREDVLDTSLCSFCPQRDAMERIVLELAMERDLPMLGICRGIQYINVALGGTLYQDLPIQHPSEVNHHQQAPYDLPAHEIEIMEGTPLYTVAQTVVGTAAKTDTQAAAEEASKAAVAQTVVGIAAKTDTQAVAEEASKAAVAQTVVGTAAKTDAHAVTEAAQLAARLRKPEGSVPREVTKRLYVGVNSCHHQAVRDLAPELKVMAMAEDGIIEAFYHPEKRFLWAVQWHPEFSWKTDLLSKTIFRAFITAAEDVGNDTTAAGEAVER